VLRLTINGQQVYKIANPQNRSATEVADDYVSHMAERGHVERLDLLDGGYLYVNFGIITTFQVEEAPDKPQGARVTHAGRA